MSEPTSGQPSFFSGVRLVRLPVVSQPILPPPGIVYSTGPVSALDDEGLEYVVKGPDPEVVVAEAVASLLATRLSIDVPEFALATIPDREGVFFASEKLIHAMRDVEPLLMSADPLVLRRTACIIVFDIWTANTDRNIGNLLGSKGTESSGSVIPVAIDFERSMSLRSRHPLIEVGQLDPSQLWPRGVLGDLMAGVDLPSDFVTMVQSLETEAVEEAVTSVATMLPESYDWPDSTLAVLRRRQQRLDRLAAEVWR